MDSIQQLFAIDLKAFGLTIFIVLLGLQTCIKLMQWFLFDLLGIETKAMREKKQEHELLLTTADELKKLSKKHEKDINSFLDSRVHDREQSLSIQKELTVSQERITKSINSLSDKLAEMQENTNNRFKENDEKVIVEEMSFTPGACLADYYTQDGNKYLGSLLDIKNVREN